GEFFSREHLVDGSVELGLACVRATGPFGAGPRDVRGLIGEGGRDEGKGSVRHGSCALLHALTSQAISKFPEWKASKNSLPPTTCTARRPFPRVIVAKSVSTSWLSWRR